MADEKGREGAADYPLTRAYLSANHMIVTKIICTNCQGEGTRPVRGGVMVCVKCSGQGVVDTPWRPALIHPEMVLPLKTLMEVAK